MPIPNCDVCNKQPANGRLTNDGRLMACDKCLAKQRR